MTVDMSDHDQTPSSQSTDDAGDDDASSTPAGDGYDREPLLTAEDVGVILQLPTKSVYELPIPKVRISQRRIRYRPEDVEEFIESRASES